MPSRSHPAVTAGLLALSGFGGWLAHFAGLPLPFLLGALIASASVAVAGGHHLPRGYAFPPWLRLAFIAVIGLMIGAQITPGMVQTAGRMAWSLGALVLFVPLAHATGYAVLRHLGGYDPVTAFYAATPGGLYESIALGEAAGADLPRLMLQQFLRIVVVVTALPAALSLWTGTPVGSAAGLSLARAAVPWMALPGLALAAAAGLAGGRALRLPAWQLTGPMAVGAALSLSGLADPAVPQWLVSLAQLVVGTALGLRFAGIDARMIMRGAGLALVSVGLVLGLGAGFAALLHPLTGEPADVLLISFAPGGVTEMALVALSLGANPAYVTLHHVWRIVLTVLGLGIAGRWRARRATGG